MNPDDENDLTDALESADCLEDQLDILLSGCMDCGTCKACIDRSIADYEEQQNFHDAKGGA